MLDPIDIFRTCGRPVIPTDHGYFPCALGADHGGDCEPRHSDVEGVVRAIERMRREHPEVFEAE